MHGFLCPNDKLHIHYSPVDHQGNKINRKTKSSDLIQLFGSSCPIVAIYSQICSIRRSENLINYHMFINNVTNNLWYLLHNSNVRILLSIIETFADFKQTQAAGTAASLFIRMERLSRMVSLCKSDLQIIKTGILKDMPISTESAPDTIKNMLIRLRALLFNHPIVWLIFYTILSFDLEQSDHMFKRCDKLEYYKIFDFPKIESLPLVHQLLRPSTANIKYMDLYFKKHQQKSYGQASHIPERDIRFFTNNKCYDILDLGCGGGKMQNQNLNITRYDPSVTKYSALPLRSFNGLMSYDVLEHIPEDELPILAKWLLLYCNKCIVLGIACFPAIEILDNGENAHCTVHEPKWWIYKIQSLLPSFQIVDTFISSKLNYVTLHLQKTT